ncbi:MAG: hypothetical protein AAGJ73_05100 [Pseudomonadota bacterium]
MIRAVLLAISAVGAAVALGRKFADKTIEDRLPTEIEAAKELAIRELDSQVDARVDLHLRQYSLTLLAKAGLVAAAYLLFHFGVIDEAGFRIAVLSLIAAYVGYDVFRIAPRARTAWRLFHAYGFNIKRAVKEYVAAIVFDRAYEQTHARLKAGAAGRVVAVSNYSASVLSQEVAQAVSDVAAGVSFERVKPRVITAALKSVGMLALYAAFIALTIWI